MSPQSCMGAGWSMRWARCWWNYHDDGDDNRESQGDDISDDEGDDNKLFLGVDSSETQRLLRAHRSLRGHQ